MRAYWAAILVVVLGGCDQPVVATVDSGPRQDGGVDAGSTSPCARDGDCSDDLFCTGQERCMPGAAGADARGCVTFAVPCTADACDEATGTCAACSEPDMDGDGQRSIGPMAQDWHRAFAFNADDKTINQGDFDGVNFAAVKALEARTAELREKTAEIDRLRADLTATQARLEALEAVVQRMAAQKR